MQKRQSHFKFGFHIDFFILSHVMLICTVIYLGEMFSDVTVIFRKTLLLSKDLSFDDSWVYKLRILNYIHTILNFHKELFVYYF
jgi:hypothetical protein